MRCSASACAGARVPRSGEHPGPEQLAVGVVATRGDLAIATGARELERTEVLRLDGALGIQARIGPIGLRQRDDLRGERRAGELAHPALAEELRVVAISREQH